MKNKKLLKALAALTMSVAAVGTVSLFGCSHTHTYSEEWDKSAEGHWHNATCEHTDEKTEVLPHVYTDDTDESCNECGYIRVIETPPAKHEHSWSEWKQTEDGSQHYKECTADGCTNPPERKDVGDHQWIDSETEEGKEVCQICNVSRNKQLPPDTTLEEAKSAAKTALETYKNAEDYTVNADALAAAINAGKAAIDAAETNAAVEEAKLAAMEAINAIKSDAQLAAEALAAKKTAAKAELAEYKKNGNYTVNKAAFDKAKADGAAAIDEATTEAGVNDALATAKAAIDAIRTDEEEAAAELAAAKEAAKAALEAFRTQITETMPAEVKAGIEKAITDGKAAVDEAQTVAAVKAARDEAEEAIQDLINSTKSIEELRTEYIGKLSAYATAAKQDKTDAVAEAIDGVVAKYATENTGLFYADTITNTNIDDVYEQAVAEIDAIVADATMTIYDKLVAQNKTLVTIDNSLAAETKLAVKENNDKVGIYMLVDSGTDYTEQYVKVIDETVGDATVKALQQVGTGATGKPNIITDTVIGQTKGKLEGYFEFKLDTLISATSTSSQQPIRFLDAAGNVKLLIGEKKNGNLYYKIGSGAEVDITATKLVVNEYSTVYFVFENGKLSVKINDKEVITDAEIGDSLGCVRLISSNKGGRRVTARKIIVVGTAMTVGEKAEAKLAQLTAAYGAYDLVNTTLYDDKGKAQLTAAYNAGKALLEGYITDAEATDELINKAYNDAIAAMKAVLTIEQSALANAKTTAIAELNDTDKTKYTINAEAVESAIADGVNAINAAATAEKITEALNAAKAAIAEIDDDEAAITKLKAAAVDELEAYDGGAANFTVEGEGGNKAAYEAALSAGTKAINDVTVSETLTPVEAKAAIATALGNAKTAIDEIDNDAELLEKAKTAAIADIDKYVADKKTEIDGKVTSGEITDTEKVAAVKAEIDSIRNTRVRAIEAETTDTIAKVNAEKTQAINNIETEVASLTASPEQLRELAEKAIRDHATPLITDYPDYAAAIEKIRDDALTLLAKESDKEEISKLQATTTRKMSVYVAEHEAYKEINNHATELKASIYNDAAKSAIDEEIKRGSDLDSGSWSADMWAIHIAEEKANVDAKKQVVINALDKIVADLKATTFTVTIVGVDNVTATAKYGQQVVIDASKLPDNVMVKGWYIDASMAEAFDLDTLVYDDITLYAKTAEATLLSDGCTWSYSANKATLPEKLVGTDLTENSSKGSMELAPPSELKSPSIEVTIKGSEAGNYIKVTVKSTSGSNWSTIGVKDEDGNYIEIAEEVKGKIAKDPTKNLYAVQSETVSVLTFKTVKAGTYTIFAEVVTIESSFGKLLGITDPISRSARITAIEVKDDLKAENDVFVTWGDEQKSYYHEQAIVVPEYTGTDGAFQYWYVEGNEEGTHYLAGEKVELPAGTYKMVANTVSANVTITYKVDDKEYRVVSYYLADGQTGVENTVAAPEKEGYTFKGWYKTDTPADTDEPFDFSKVAPNANDTIFAVFEQIVSDSWAFDFANADKVSTTTNLSNGAVIGDGAITVTTSSSTKLHTSGYLTTGANSVFTFEVAGNAVFKILYNGNQSTRTFVIKDSSGATVGSGAMSKTEYSLNLSKGTYTIEFAGGEHKITNISLTYA